MKIGNILSAMLLATGVTLASAAISPNALADEELEDELDEIEEDLEDELDEIEEDMDDD